MHQIEQQSYLMLIGISKLRSKVSSRSHINVTNTEDGPSIPSLSSGLLRVRFFDPGAIPIGLSDSLRRSAIEPTTGLGSPTTLTRPMVSPTGTFSTTKNVSEEAPFSKKQRLSWRPRNDGFLVKWAEQGLI